MSAGGMRARRAATAHCSWRCSGAWRTRARARMCCIRCDASMRPRPSQPAAGARAVQPDGGLGVPRHAGASLAGCAALLLDGHHVAQVQAHNPFHDDALVAQQQHAVQVTRHTAAAAMGSSRTGARRLQPVPLTCNALIGLAMTDGISRRAAAPVLCSGARARGIPAACEQSFARGSADAWRGGGVRLVVVRVDWADEHVALERCVHCRQVQFVALPTVQHRLRHVISRHITRACSTLSRLAPPMTTASRMVCQHQPGRGEHARTGSRSTLSNASCSDAAPITPSGSAALPMLERSGTGRAAPERRVRRQHDVDALAEWTEACWDGCPRVAAHDHGIAQPAGRVAGRDTHKVIHVLAVRVSGTERQHTRVRKCLI